MANYLIGLDFGTSQTKVCLLSKGENRESREFLKFENDSYFIPSLIVKKNDNTFSYGDENSNGTKYRYFKMAAAEDEDLVQVTNEDLNGNLQGEIDDFRKYSTNFEINPEILVVLYLTYIFLYIKKKKKNEIMVAPDRLLGRLAGNVPESENTFAINLGIPTEWNNPDHIKRKIKFQSLLLTAVTLGNQCQNLEEFLSVEKAHLLDKISRINVNNLKELANKNPDERDNLIKTWLQKQNLSVFPESAAGINYLLKTERLDGGCYATLDIGAGTSDIAIFRVSNHTLIRYYSSESTAIASNDVYREYAQQLYPNDVITFDEIKKAEDIIRNSNEINRDFYDRSLINVRGALDGRGIVFAIRKTFYKYYIQLHRCNHGMAFRLRDQLSGMPIIVFGGGANFNGYCSGNYCFFRGAELHGNFDDNFEAKPMTDYVQQVNISNDKDEIQKYVNLLVLALGLTYCEQNGDYIPFGLPPEDLLPAGNPVIPLNTDRYFYYDLQDAAYK